MIPDKEFILRPSKLGCDQCVYLSYRREQMGCYLVGTYWCQCFKKEVFGRKRLDECKELLKEEE